MSAIWPFFRRLINIIFAYLLASCSSGFVLACLMQVLPGQMATRNGNAPEPFIEILYPACFLISVFAAPLAAITIMIGEWKNIRRKRYYAVAGTLIGLTLSLLFLLMQWFPVVGVGYGAVAGLIYWWVAGRWAGSLDARGSALLQITLALVLAAAILLALGFSPFR